MTTTLNPVRLNLGCGDIYKEGFINIDQYNPKADSKVDLSVFPYPFEKDYADEIVMSHVIEHISWQSTTLVLSELYRILVPNGKLSLSYPDFELCAKSFLENRMGMKWTWWIQTLYGMQINDGQYHKAPIVTAKLIGDLTNIGFGNFNVIEDTEWDRTVTCVKTEGLPWFVEAL